MRFRCFGLAMIFGVAIGAGFGCASTSSKAAPPPAAPTPPTAAAPAPDPTRPATALREPDVIYVPTPQEVVDAMLKMANVTASDTVYDLGSGDGRIPITAAQKY